MIIDAKDAVMGRLASNAATTLLKGDRVVIINAEKAIVTGSPASIKGKWMRIKNLGSPQHGPFLHKAPDKVLRRTIRGMMPYKKSKGRDAMKRLRVFTGTPENMNEIKGAEEIISLTKPVRSNFMYLEEICKSLGWAG